MLSFTYYTVEAQ